MFEQFAAEARTVVTDAVAEAEHRGDRRLGTEHLLVAVLGDADVAARVGADAAAAREAAVRLDREALAETGLDVGDLDIEVPPNTRPRRHVRFSPAAKGVLRDALGYAVTEKSRRITPRHLALALVELRAPDPAAVLMAALTDDPRRVRRSLADPAGP